MNIILQLGNFIIQEGKIACRISQLGNHIPVYWVDLSRHHHQPRYDLRAEIATEIYCQDLLLQLHVKCRVPS